MSRIVAFLFSLVVAVYPHLYSLITNVGVTWINKLLSYLEHVHDHSLLGAAYDPRITLMDMYGGLDGLMGPAFPFWGTFRDPFFEKVHEFF